MKEERLEKMLIIMAIAYTIAVEKGEQIKKSPHKFYVERQRKIQQKLTKNSNFWVGIYGENWARGGIEMEKWAKELVQINSNQCRFYQRGLKAMAVYPVSILAPSSPREVTPTKTKI